MSKITFPLGDPPLPKPSLTLSLYLSFTIYFQVVTTLSTLTLTIYNKYIVLFLPRRSGVPRKGLTLHVHVHIILEQIQLVILGFCIYHPIDFYHFTIHSSSTSGKTKAKAENGNSQTPKKQAKPLNLTQKRVEL